MLGQELKQFFNNQDVKFIRLAFVDMLGNLKNIAITVNEAEKAFDTGIILDSSSICGFAEEAKTDLYLKPVESTLALMPWRASQGTVVRFFCDILYSDGTPFKFNTRDALIAAVARAKNAGFTPKIGQECEFYLFKTDGTGEPTLVPFDSGTCFDVFPLDRGEDTRRDICVTLDEVGIRPESSHHEGGPGQNEIDFASAEALTAADNFLTFKSVVRAASGNHGAYASFMPKPISRAPGSGLHLNFELLTDDGKNAFADGNKLSDTAYCFIGGIMSKIREITAFLNPMENSYARLGEFEAPSFVSWSKENRFQLIRVPSENGANIRIEVRSPDPTINPYAAFALILNAGLDGIAQKIKPLPPTDLNLEEADDLTASKYEKLPLSLKEALNLARDSAFCSKILGKDYVESYYRLKTEELRAYMQSADKSAHFFENYFIRT
ncbi:MAG: glutamine synthetase family protein [Christensenellaceae bacterium]|jgi:glutamine synthetase|nr:glutamine synthetase family protein [Christensenellaceae bacterium]